MKSIMYTNSLLLICCLFWEVLYWLQIQLTTWKRMEGQKLSPLALATAITQGKASYMNSDDRIKFWMHGLSKTWVVWFENSATIASGGIFSEKSFSLASVYSSSKVLKKSKCLHDLAYGKSNVTDCRWCRSLLDVVHLCLTLSQVRIIRRYKTQLLLSRSRSLTEMKRRVWVW